MTVSQMPCTFLGIGAQKCASSWVHDILADHPEVAVPKTKEVDFFSYRFEYGFRWYESHWADRPDAQSTGEVSPSYFHEPGVVERARSYRPDLKVVVSLRDPVERALSQHRHLVRLGRVPGHDLSFESALTTNPTYIDQGRYFTHLSRWIQAFGVRNVHVMLMDDIRRDPADVARGLYRFLGISERHRSRALRHVSNESFVPRHQMLERAVGGLRVGMERIGAGTAWRLFGQTGARTVYRKLNRLPSAAVIPPPSAKTLAQLRSELASEMNLLGELLNRDIGHWSDR